MSSERKIVFLVELKRMKGIFSILLVTWFLLGSCQTYDSQPSEELQNFEYSGVDSDSVAHTSQQDNKNPSNEEMITEESIEKSLPPQNTDAEVASNDGLRNNPKITDIDNQELIKRVKPAEISDIEKPSQPEANSITEVPNIVGDNTQNHLRASSQPKIILPEEIPVIPGDGPQDQLQLTVFPLEDNSEKSKIIPIASRPSNEQHIEPEPPPKNTEISTSLSQETQKGNPMTTMILSTIICFFVILSAIFLSKISKLSKKLKSMDERFKDVISVEDEVAKLSHDSQILSEKIERMTNEFEAKEASLQHEYIKKKNIFDRLESEVQLLEGELETMEFGIYKPYFVFEASEKYKEMINTIREKQKTMVKNSSACSCSTEWTVSGSKSEGRKMTNKNIKLMLRAFNGECDALISKVSWNNINSIEARIDKAFEVLNKLGQSNQISLSPDYLKLKLEELHAAYEFQVKKQEEKEEQRAIREQMREEEKVRKEIEKAKEKAEKEEEQYLKALEKAREEVSHATGQKLEKLKNEMELLQQRLEETQQNKERALSRAQQTRSGHVYVISNIGSFGEDIYKIGLTRRLEPLDRVRELGDASVPFAFDVHAMIYSDDAPALETKLHNIFTKERVNLINTRKEFFKVPLEEIEKVVNNEHANIIFTKVAEAKEYRESSSIRKDNIHKSEEPNQLPDAI